MSEVSPLAFRNSLFVAFEAFWAGRTEIAVPNREDFDPATLPAGDTAYVRLFILGDGEGQTRLSNSVARNHYSNEGTFTVSVMVRQGGDLDEAYTLATAVGLFLENPGVADSFFRNLGPPIEVGPDGSWFEVDVSARWLYWTDRAA